MAIQLISKPFGKIEISEKQLIYFPVGLLGFETYNQFALIEENAESPFKWLQSTDEPGLAFILIQPELFIVDYKPAVSESELEELELDTLGDGVVFVIVTIPHDDPMKMTANLQGPVIINPKNSAGRQLISRNENHSVRARIIEGSAQMEKV
ncbi:MAG: flagellar assembly protein FliW [Leptospira sp.]|nr:flagellar assembly protein FliW [Leptospira sp.]